MSSPLALELKKEKDWVTEKWAWGWARYTKKERAGGDERVER